METLKRAVESRFGFVTQPIFLFAEIESYHTNLGVERTNQSYPFKSMLEQGAILSFSSDAPATSWNDTSSPFIGIKAAVTRKSYIGTEFNRDQQIGVEEAIALYTRHSGQISRIPRPISNMYNGK